jgi:ankyrin repeat protein
MEEGMAGHEFEFVRGKSKKFWSIELLSRSYTVHFGRQGSPGQKKPKEFPSEAKAKVAYVKSILKKIEEGYTEVKRRAHRESVLQLKDLPKGRDLLLYAIQTKCSERQVRFLLENGVDANAEGQSGVSALNAAIHTNSPQIVQLLLEHGADAKGKDWMGRPLLISAADWYPKLKKAVFDLLVEYGAVKDLTAELYLEGAKRVAEKIKRNPKLLEALDDPVELMNYAIEKKAPNLVELLLDLGINPNAHGERHPAPLRMAVGMNSARLVKLLLERGADANPRDATKRSLLKDARRLHECTVESAGRRVLKRWENRQKPKIIELLQRHGSTEK